MFLIAPGTQALAKWDGAEREKRRERQIRKDCLTEKISPEARRYEDRTRIETDAADLHRQVDAQDSVFTERQTLSTRAVAPPPRQRLPEDADPNPSQSGIHGLDR
jgi:hypothetical protein